MDPQLQHRHDPGNIIVHDAGHDRNTGHLLDQAQAPGWRGCKDTLGTAAAPTPFITVYNTATTKDFYYISILKISFN